MNLKERVEAVQQHLDSGQEGRDALYRAIEVVLTRRLQESRGCSFFGGIRNFPDYERYELLDPEAFWKVMGEARVEDESLAEVVCRFPNEYLRIENPPHPLIAPVDGPTPLEVWEAHRESLEKENPQFIPWRLVDAPTEVDKDFRGRVVDAAQEVLGFDIKPPLPDPDEYH